MPGPSLRANFRLNQLPLRRQAPQWQDKTEFQATQSSPDLRAVDFAPFQLGQPDYISHDQTLIRPRRSGGSIATDRAFRPKITARGVSASHFSSDESSGEFPSVAYAGRKVMNLHPGTSLTRNTIPWTCPKSERHA